ncbi:MAG: phospholipase A [Desulfobacterium sp.]|nr:phospholipase A [Desulfobacterium sp.]
MFMLSFKKRLIKIAISLFFVSLFMCLSVGDIWADLQNNLCGCAVIKDDALRLKCYDEISARIQPTGAEPVPIVQRKPSYLSQLWELDKDPFRGKLAIKMHRSNYILPISYNWSPNGGPIEAATPGREVLESEVAFQLSLKTKLWEDILGKDLDLWFGYTQRSFWQLYNFKDSAPFRETNYEPEVFINLPMDIPLPGVRLRSINFGINHQSNGKSAPLSRSWNRIVANVGFERESLFGNRDSAVLELKSWYRIPESGDSDDNPNIDDYMGNGSIWGYYLWEKHRFGMMLRNNLNFDDNHGAMQLEWSFPLNDRVSGYIQYFTGYGESLLDYDHSVNRLGMGFILTDWD